MVVLLFAFSENYKLVELPDLEIGRLPTFDKTVNFTNFIMRVLRTGRYLLK